MIQLMVLHWGTFSVDIILRGKSPKRGRICRPRKTGILKAKISGGGPA